MAAETFIDPSEETGAALVRRQIQGEIVMLNLIRLNPIADYSAYPELAPEKPTTGREAYQRYIDHTRPFLEASGGSIVYAGEGGDYFIGPVGEGWDFVMLIRQRSMQAFFAFASDPECMKGIGHRVAAVRDSRIVPLEDAAI